jgi:hypothetical protein
VRSGAFLPYVDTYTYLLACVSRHFHVGSFLLTCRLAVSWY